MGVTTCVLFREEKKEDIGQESGDADEQGMLQTDVGPAWDNWRKGVGVENV